MTNDTRTAMADWFQRSGRSQAEIAAFLGISEAHISRMVNGQRQPSLGLAVRISELTGIPAVELLSKVA